MNCCLEVLVIRASKKPEVVYKPKLPVAGLNKEHAQHLHNIVHGGLMRKIIPSDIEEQFIKQGYVRRVIGGTVATDIGHRVLMEFQRGNRG